jgi:hypothetical protein
MVLCGTPADSITSWIKLPVLRERLTLGRRSRRWAAERLLDDDPAAGPQERRDPAEGMGGVRLVHQKAPSECEIKPAPGQSLDHGSVHVAGKHVDVVKAECRNDRTRHAQVWVAEVDADDATVRSDDLREHGEPADRPAAAVDRIPPVVGADSAKRGAGGVLAELRDPQEPT